MTDDSRAEYVTRESIMKLLSDDEVARVSMAETAQNLSKNDEFIDLEHVSDGVKGAAGVPARMGTVLPRKAVHPDTWTKILAHFTSATRER
jgi:hypothetical protein